MKRVDLILVGGGLSSLLVAFRLRSLRPSVKFLILERSGSVGGNHTWSFHTEDIEDKNRSWVAPLISKSWSGYQVKFPDHGRDLGSGYHSIASEDLARKAMSSFGESIRQHTEVTALTPTEVILNSGERIEAGCVIDARGWERPGNVPLGYQKFIGRKLRLTEPHGLTSPVVMDATIPQIDGYRFFYLLPFSTHEIMVEDTYYSERPHLDRTKIVEEIGAYVEAKGWRVDKVDYEEVGCLPIPLAGDLPEWSRGVARIGLRGGFFHATTGYSFPSGVIVADFLARLPALTCETVYSELRREAVASWRRGSFYRLLNRMMFHAARPEERYLILRRFYRLPEPLIQRFYAGRTTLLDRAKLLLGRPPVPIRSAVKTLWETAYAY